MTDENWDALVNPFAFRLEGRGLMHGFFTDHVTKLEARKGSDPVLGELWELTRPVWEDWQRDYQGWSMAAGERRSATYVLMGRRRQLLVSPRGEGRSLLDEWESGLSGRFPPGGERYVGLFPRGRAGIYRAGLDEIGPELVRIAERLEGMLPELTAERDALRAEAQGYTTAGLAVQEELEQQLEAAEWRVDGSPGIARRMRRFGENFVALRTDQQGKEGLLTEAALTLNATHHRAHWRLFANLGRLIDWAITTTSGGPVQIGRVAGFFDLKMLPKRKTKKAGDAGLGKVTTVLSI